MRKVFALAFALQLCLLATMAFAAGKSTKPAELAKQGPPTQADVLALADKYAADCAKKLQDQDKQAVADVQKTIADNKFSDIFFKKAIDGLITNLTLKLASTKSLDGLTVSSALVLKEVPKNKRALNLFGSVLNISAKDKDAVRVFQYTLTLDPKNTLFRLNLANCYLDSNQDELAKKILDKLEFEDPNNKAVFRALATYYYKKNNAARFREYLFKAASFKGYKRKKAEKSQEKVDKNEVTQGDSVPAMETKLEQLETIVPLTPADILEEDYPAAAQKIRDKYAKLAENEKWILPKLPMVNINTPEDYKKNKPIIEEWIEVAKQKFSVFPKRQAQSMGIDVNASEKVQQQQAKAAAKKQVTEAMQQAQQALKYMENMPGVSKADLAKAKAQMAKVMQQQNIKVEDKPVDRTAPPPGMDRGSIFAVENWQNLKKIETSYLHYFMKYHKEMMAKFADIMKVYQQKMKEEDDRYADEAKRLGEEHSLPGNPHGDADEPCRRASINHKKMLNQIGLNYYHQWSNLYCPQYAQKMKPTMDAYFNVCMLHIRNINDPKLLVQEYSMVTGIYTMYSLQSMSYIGMGDDFHYDPETEELERQLEEDIAKAKEQAEAKNQEFQRDFKAPEFSYTDWINDHFVLEVSGEFLSLKVTAKSIEFEAYVPGVGAGAKYDFSEQKFETYTGFGGKVEVGVNICGLGAKAEAKGDFYRRTATWDLANGKYTETDSAKGEAKASFGPLGAGGEFEVDTQLNAKVTTKVSFMDTLTVQDEQQLK